jgi:hypothetical protein
MMEVLMDPITTAILAALPVLGTDVAKSAVKDAYDGLKAVIQRKWGASSPVGRAVTSLEEDPKSKAQAAVLEEKVAAVKATEDSDVLQALQALVEALKASGQAGEQVANIQFTMSGGTVQGVAGAGSVNVGTMNFGLPGKN